VDKKQPDVMGDKPVAKKAYAVPRLVVYGDLRTITQTAGMTGADGGGMAGMTFSQ
jgi:hypothetical protein